VGLFFEFAARVLTTIVSGVKETCFTSDSVYHTIQRALREGVAHDAPRSVQRAQGGQRV
jgi:hypothetical protein